MYKPPFDTTQHIAIPRETLEQVSRRLRNIALSPSFHSNLGICGIIRSEINTGIRDHNSLNRAMILTFNLIQDSNHYSGIPQYPVPPLPDFGYKRTQEIHQICKQYYEISSANKTLWSKSTFYGKTRRSMALEICNHIDRILNN